MVTAIGSSGLADLLGWSHVRSLSKKSIRTSMHMCPSVHLKLQKSVRFSKKCCY